MLVVFVFHNQEQTLSFVVSLHDKYIFSAKNSAWYVTDP